MTQTEALKLLDEYIVHVRAMTEHITAIKEALAQPEQEPVAWANSEGGVVWAYEDVGGTPNWTDYYNIPLYTTPPQRKPLTDAQSERLYRNIEPSRQQDARSLAAFKRLLRVIEAAHGIKGDA